MHASRVRLVLTVAVAAAAVAVGSLWGASVAGAATSPAPKLALGESTFWQGPFAASARVPDPSLCGLLGRCWSWNVDVAPGSPRLRVAIGTLDATNDYLLQLFDPSGNLVSSDETTTSTLGLFTSHRYAVEVFAPDPAPGVWQVRVVPVNVTSGDFRARAKLEGETAAAASVVHGAAKCKKKRKKHGRHHKRKPCKRKKRKHGARGVPKAETGSGPLLPNLEIDPPWDLTFKAPLPSIPPGPTHLSSVATTLGLHHVDGSLGGLNPSSCSPDESVDDPSATHCLRFSTGVPNFGAGPFTILGTIDPTDPVNGFVSGPLDQRITNADGTHTDVPAGSYEFHPVHFHFHVTHLAEFRLLKINGDDPSAPPTEAAKGLKEGFCLENVKMASFDQFIQGVPNPDGDCLPQPQGTDLSFTEEITQGWEDVYDWETPGQYIDFGDNPNGLYMIQMKINLDGQFHETNLHDDVGYTYFRVDGNDIHVIERGRGSSPWDPGKVVLDPVQTW
jgi:hypothetical protein